MKEKDGRVDLTAFESLSLTDKRLVEQEAERLFTPRKMIWA